MTTVPQLAQTLQIVFTTTADAAARATGFVQRRSKLSGAAFVQALVFGWLANPHASLAALAQAAAVAGVAISPQGLDQRCGEAAAGFLEAVLAAAVQAVVAAEPVAIPLLQRFSAVVLLDCSTIVLPDALGLWWPGCGGSSATHTQAALKLGVRFDLCSGALRGPLLYDGRTHESTTPIQSAPLPAGALRLADLGFFDLEARAQIGAQDGYWLSRLHFGTAVYDAEGRRWDVLDLLAAQGTAQVALPIALGAQQRLSARLLAVRVPQEVAVRVPQEVADQRRRRLRLPARDRGRTPSAARLAWCDWTLLVTNVPPDMLSLREALVLARARWQIELLFKLWKSHGHIDESRSGKPWRVLCEVYAKLLAMVVQHWLLLTGCWASPDRSLVKAAQTVRHHAMHLASALACPAALAAAITVIHRCLAAGCRLNRRKKKPNTYQLLLDPALAGLG
jgi:Transposase DDE domain